MTEADSTTLNTPGQPDISSPNVSDRGQINRGKLLDAFAKLEAGVRDMGKRIKAKPSPKATLSSRIEAIRKLKEGFKNPKNVEQALNQCVEFCAVRATVVHSVLALAAFPDGRPIWLFENVAGGKKSPVALDDVEFDRFIEEIGRLTNRLGQFKLKDAA